MDALKVWKHYGARASFRSFVGATTALVSAVDCATLEMRSLAGYLAEIERERIDNRADGRGWTKRKKASERKLWRKHIKKMKREARLAALPR